MQMAGSIVTLLKKRPGLLVILALLFFVVTSVASMSRKSATVDEPLHLTAGYSYLVTGNFRLNLEHPPLIKMLAALPLLPLSLDFRLLDDREFFEERIRLSRRFVFANKQPAEKIVFLSRVPMVLLGLALGGLVYLWSRQIAGTLAGILALLLYVFDPNIIANSQLVTFDLGLSLFMTLALYCLVRYMKWPSALNLWLAGAAFALSMLTKFTAIALVPIYAVLILAYRVRRGWVSVWAHSWRLSGAMVIMTMGLAFVVYGFEFRPPGPPPVTVEYYLDKYTSPSSPVRKLVLGIASGIVIPAPTFWRGLDWQRRYRLEGPGICHMMRQTRAGRCPGFYFLVFGVKTPVGTLALFALALAGFVYRVFMAGVRDTVSIDESIILSSAAIFFGLSMLQKISLGVRYILPVYPLIFIFTASQLVWLASRPTRWVRSAALIAAAGFIVWVIASSVRIFPHFSSYFNELAGGPQNGWRYVAGCDVDCGQDLPGIREYLRRHAIKEVYLEYIGPTPPEYYGIRWERVPTDQEVARIGAPRGVIAVSISSQVVNRPMLRTWLWAYRPVATIGYSTWIYDLR